MRVYAAECALEELVGEKTAPRVDDGRVEAGTFLGENLCGDCTILGKTGEGEKVRRKQKRDLESILPEVLLQIADGRPVIA